MGRERAVETLIGFVLVFSLVATSVAVVYAFGFDGLEATRDAEQLDNVESAFDVLADNIGDIQRDDAPHRATEFKLYDATLRGGEETSFTVTVTNWDADPSPPVDSVSAVPLVYRPETGGQDRSIRFVGGAVIRERGDRAHLLARPPLVLTEEGGQRTAVIPLLETRMGDTTGRSGSTTVLVRGDLVTAESLTTGTDAVADTTGTRYQVEFRIQTPSAARAAVWTDHLNGRFDAVYGETPCSITDPAAVTVTCSFETDRLFVSATRVDVAIDG